MSRTSAILGRARRRAFTLLEVVVALAVLVVCLLVLVESQATAVYMTLEAERYVIATQLAQEKLNEVQLLVEYEGFTDQDVDESGDFKDFGDEALELELGDRFDDFRWRYTVDNMDLAQLGDIAGAAQDMMGDESGEDGAPPPGATGGAGAGDAANAGMGMMGGFLAPDALTEQLGKYMRQVNVVVWWGGDDMEKAEEDGHAVRVTAHVINPNGAVRELANEEAQP